MGLRRLRPKRRRGWLWVGLTFALVANDLRLRRRLSALKQVTAGDFSSGGFNLYTGPGVQVGDDVRDAAISYASANGLDVLDLVPGDLPVAQALELAGLVDPAAYRSDPLAPGHGALHALLVRADVASRAGFAGSDRVELADWAAMAKLTATAKWYAPRTADLAVSPNVASVVPDPSSRLDLVRARYGRIAPTALATPGVVHVLLAAGLVLSPGWGWAALCAFVAEPFVAVAGTAVRPRDMGWWQAARRVVSAPAELAKTLLRATPTVDPVDACRPEYATLLAEGTEPFFEPRRETCPLCGGGALGEHLRSPDFIQSKPGEFVLDRCGACGHIFQNPRLSFAGLDFYYRDFYDGLGAGSTELVFAFGGKAHRGRVDLVGRYATPRAWLDVGSGYSHFCLTAADLLPETRFDGLDMGESIEEAQRRGWINRAYRGLFPDLAGQLEGAYDVVSMHHYLEHTRDPLAELDAAHTVLEPGGHLLIEVPNPESGFGRLIGPSWLPWFQPQHQHFLSAANLRAALVSRGFTVREVEIGPAHQSADLAGSLLQRANRLATPAPVPWLDPPAPARRVRRAVTMTLAFPFLIAAFVLDYLLAPLVRRSDGWSNAYRLVARRD